jgi:hypothetical protein
VRFTFFNLFVQPASTRSWKKFPNVDVDAVDSVRIRWFIKFQICSDLVEYMRHPSNFYGNELQGRGRTVGMGVGSLFQKRQM